MLYNVTVEQIRSWPKNEACWNIAPSGDSVKLGNGVTLGNYVTLGNGVKLGDSVTLGDGVKLGDSVTLGNGVSSIILCQEFATAQLGVGETMIFGKWVTPSRMSPNFDGGTRIKYKQGATIEVPDAITSDKQCDVGLHVLVWGMRPEWCGLCSAGHNLICLRVEVQTKDILFYGWPGAVNKVRVRALRVLD